MVREFEITPGTIRDYERYIPEICLKDMIDGKLYGSAFYDADMIPDRLIGVVVYGERYRWRCIEWVTLTENYNIPDYAADMIWYLEEDARREGKLFGTYGLIYPGEEHLLTWYKMAGFSVEEELSNVFTLTLSEISEDALKLTKPSENIREFDAVSRDLVNEMEAIVDQVESPLPVEEDILEDYFVGDLSLLYVDEEGPKGILLVSESDRLLSVDLLFSVNPKVVGVLLGTALLRAKERYAADTKIVIPITSVQSAQLVEKLAPGAKREMLKKAYRVYEPKKRIPKVKAAGRNADVNKA